MSVELRMTTDGRITSPLGDIDSSLVFNSSQPPRLVVIAADAVEVLREQPHIDNSLSTTVTQAEDHTFLHLAGPEKRWTWQLQSAHWADPDDKPAVMLGELVP
ncbi:hypothetical protein [Mycobacterium gordonae]|uniref:Uncharacterized protein n=1 Tax=Mycobacterium gordonae TaxID=1778 RepID=A0A1X1WPW5_MYCGO|nr:hypothetical protein [Mycobacterium gordonae]MCV7004612.1 hypothetical protein [Mycobacterium gordonae]ODR16036.1 hypothetical protein BHQ23_31340 [Mycobacterium gordonae]ORV88532.1 hypothetical protein AWC08_22340 [Mycobacterium gordonae]